MSTKATSILPIDPKSSEIVETYKKTSSIYYRTNVALGRIPQYKVTASSTKGIKVTNERGESTKSTGNT